jgi:hypothetical protein
MGCRSQRSLFLFDAQGRDHVTHAELALDRDGKFLGLRVSTQANIGGYISTFGPNIPTNLYGPLLAGVYTTPAIYCEVKVVFTNTVPTDAYRGVGRPEATFVLERLIDVRGARYRHRSSRNSAAQLVMRWEGIPAGLLTTVAACGLPSGSGLSICIEKHHG